MLSGHYAVRTICCQDYMLSRLYVVRTMVLRLCCQGYRERHSQLQSSLTCRDVVKKKKKNVVIQTVKVIPSSNLRPRWQTMEVGGIPQNESKTVEYLQKKKLFLLCQRFLF